MPPGGYFAQSIQNIADKFGLPVLGGCKVLIAKEFISKVFILIGL
jgi:hypothetical protein